MLTASFGSIVKMGLTLIGVRKGTQGSKSWYEYRKSRGRKKMKKNAG